MIDLTTLSKQDKIKAVYDLLQKADVVTVNDGPIINLFFESFPQALPFDDDEVLIAARWSEDDYEYQLAFSPENLANARIDGRKLIMPCLPSQLVIPNPYIEDNEAELVLFKLTNILL
jgi:hypothetical protein